MTDDVIDLVAYRKKKENLPSLDDKRGFRLRKYVIGSIAFCTALRVAGCSWKDTFAWWGFALTGWGIWMLISDLGERNE